ncbi:MAG: acyltransferase [Pedosphaera sp.]|nr:acyltransferase [Pedosphaera sp.]
MSISNPIFSLVLMGLILFMAAAISKHWRFYAELGLRESANPGRTPALDGLRGFLAFGVFFHHCLAWFGLVRLGKAWAFPLHQDPGMSYYAALGPVSVDFFFMISGYLFWTKAIESEGRIRPLKLYRNRFLRIAPLYLFSASCILACVFFKTGLRLAVPARDLIGDLLGMCYLGFFTLGTINGVYANNINAGVFWSLHYEWLFYAILPFIAVCARPRRAWAFIAITLLLCLWSPEDVRPGFWVGIVTAHVARQPTVRKFLCSAPATACLLACISLSLWGSIHGSPLLTALLLAFPFAAFACGNGIFGLLTSAAARQLGTISYSIYLLHGIVLYLGVSLVQCVVPLSALSVPECWLLCSVFGLALPLLCSLTYRYIEHPFLGKLSSRKPESLSSSPLLQRQMNAVPASPDVVVS